MHLSCAAVTLVALSLLTLASAAEGDDETKVADNSASSTAFSLPAFTQAFGESFAVILATEIGDRTFFIAAIMAMRHSRLVVWAGAVGALAVMTVLSTLVGHVAPLLIPKQYTHYMAAALFLYFGLKMLRESFSITHAGEPNLAADGYLHIRLFAPSSDTDWRHLNSRERLCAHSRLFVRHLVSRCVRGARRG